MNEILKDQFYMRRALALAVRYCGLTEPNPVVGALVVQRGRIVGKGAHVRAGLEHAEVVALRQAGDRARGATLYVTLEPCNHHGRTGPCSKAILAAGISRVVFGLSDPNPVASGGADFLRQHGIEVSSGVMAEEIAVVLSNWLFSLKNKRASSDLVAVLGLDGTLLSRVPRLVKKYFRNAVNILSGQAIFEKAEFDRMIVVRTTDIGGADWPRVHLDLDLERFWQVGNSSFSIYVKSK